MGRLNFFFFCSVHVVSIVQVLAAAVLHFQQIHIYANHHNPENFSDPETFDPSRFDPGRERWGGVQRVR